MKTHFFLLIIFLSFLPFDLSAETLYVNSNKLNVRSGPGEKYAVKCEYGNGFPLTIIQRKGDWVEVSDFEKDKGWVLKRLLSKKPHAIVRVYKGMDKKINIRSGPGTGFSSVGQAYYGVVFSVLEKKGSWIKVKHESGLIGWIRMDFLWGI